MALVVLVRVRSEIPSVYKTLQEIHEEVEAEGRCRLNIQVIMEHGFKDDDQARRALYPVSYLVLKSSPGQLQFLLGCKSIWKHAGPVKFCEQLVVKVPSSIMCIIASFYLTKRIILERNATWKLMRLYTKMY